MEGIFILVLPFAANKKSHLGRHIWLQRENSMTRFSFSPPSLLGIAAAQSAYTSTTWQALLGWSRLSNSSYVLQTPLLGSVIQAMRSKPHYLILLHWLSLLTDLRQNLKNQACSPLTSLCASGCQLNNLEYSPGGLQNVKAAIILMVVYFRSKACCSGNRGTSVVSTQFCRQRNLGFVSHIEAD